MFATPYSLKKRTGKLDTPRGEYLKQLVAEYRAPETSEEQREQVLANLANFGYDPINYEYFRRFGVLDVFVEQLNESRRNARNNSRVNLKLLCFALGGLCNVCLDPRNKPYLLERDLIDLVAYFLRTPVDDNDSPLSIEIVLNCLTCLHFVSLEDETVRERVAAYRDENICLGMLVKTAMCASSNKRIANLANVFVQDLKI